MKRLLLVTAMFLLGFAALGAFGWIVAAGRNETKLPPLPRSSATYARAPREGLLLSMRAARSALALGDASSAAQALDAAKRASDVARYAGAAPRLFGDVYERVENARAAIQDFDDRGAAGEVERAVALLEQAPDLVNPGRPAAVAGYEDAAVIDPRGVRIGAIAGTAAPDSVVLTIGGLRDVLGFIDAGGRTARVPAGDILRGERRTVGATMVMLTRPPD